MQKTLRATLLLLALALPETALADTRPIVLELFTSQGCAACVPAENLLQSLNKPGIIVLSLHIKYFDNLGWVDTFATEENTLRQSAYNQVLHEALYTPQLVVDGLKIAPGNERPAVETAMHDARVSLPDIPITLERTNDILRVSLPDAPANAGRTTPIVGTVWALQYRKYETTEITAGENKGKRLAGLHNVTRITKLGTWTREAVTYSLPINTLGEDGIAILLQGELYGRIAGAATFND